jgi:hypothetical protein
MEGGFPGLVTVGDQATNQVNQKVDRAAMAGGFDQGNVLERVVDGFANGSLTRQQLVRQGHEAVLQAGFELGDELQALRQQLLEPGLGPIRSIPKQFAAWAAL